jgi:hypothetical protein
LVHHVVPLVLNVIQHERRYSEELSVGEVDPCASMKSVRESREFLSTFSQRVT